MTDTRGQNPIVSLFDEVVLTDDFADNVSDTFCVAPMSQVELLIAYTMNAAGSGRGVLLQIELSDDNTNWYKLAISSDGTGASGVSVSELFARQLTVQGVTGGVAETRVFSFETGAKYARVSACEDVSSPPDFGTLTLKAMLCHALTLA